MDHMCDGPLNKLRNMISDYDEGSGEISIAYKQFS